MGTTHHQPDQVRGSESEHLWKNDPPLVKRFFAYLLCALLNKSNENHGHKKRHTPRALRGPLIHVHLKAANKGSTNTVPQRINCA